MEMEREQSPSEWPGIEQAEVNSESTARITSSGCGIGLGIEHEHN